MMPSCDQTGVPGLVGLTHFHSSTTSGSACLMSVRILPRVFPRQSPSSVILFEMSSAADWPWLAPDFFMFSSLPLCAKTSGGHSHDQARNFRHCAVLHRQERPRLALVLSRPSRVRDHVSRAR